MTVNREWAEDALVLAIDIGTESARVGLVDTKGTIVNYSATDHETRFPRPSWVEQNPQDWWSGVQIGVRSLLNSDSSYKSRIAAIAVDATGSTPIPLDQNMKELSPAIMWMDLRSSEEARTIVKAVASDDRLSARFKPTGEWLPSKALWLKTKEPELWKKCKYFVEATDWLVWKLSGELIGSTSLAASRGMYDIDSGWPTNLFQEVGLADLVDRLPTRIQPPGSAAGTLSAESAAFLGLPVGIPVITGIVDALAASVGVGAIEVGKLAFITGSSHLILGPVAPGRGGPGLFGPFSDSAFAGQEFIEASQASSGSILRWYRGISGRSDDAFYEEMNLLAERIPIGSQGLILLDYLQGNRTPHADSSMSGAFIGLTLGHSAAHLYRAILEGVAYGTADACECLRNAQIYPDALLATGGATKSPLWMQITADIANVAIQVAETNSAALVGSAMLAFTSIGLYSSLAVARDRMVRYGAVYKPIEANHIAYRPLFEIYQGLYSALRPINESLITYRNR